MNVTVRAVAMTFAREGHLTGDVPVVIFTEPFVELVAHMREQRLTDVDLFAVDLDIHVTGTIHTAGSHLAIRES